MALASQTTRQDQVRRASAGSGWSSRRRRKRSRRVSVLLLLLLAAAAAAWWGWHSLAEPESALAVNPDPAATTDPLPEPDRASRAPATLPAARTQHERNAQPPVITMGQTAASPAAQPSSPPPASEPTVAATPPIQTRTEPRSAPPADNDAIGRLIADAQTLRDRNQAVQSRALMNRALDDPRATPAQRARLRALLGDLNDTLVFSTAIVDGDPLVERYVVQAGDTLSTIAERRRLFVDWRFIQRINRIADPTKIRVGQTLKLVRGPFHAVVAKSDFRLDLYAADGADSSGRIFVRSFPVGLGEHGATPTGAWVVRQDSKLVNPSWTNPRTGEFFNADDPNNPIGERWVGLDGADPQTSLLAGYGIHGTVDPDSIGKEMSMGCVRLLPGDVDVLYETMTEGVSTVQIVP